MKNHAYLIFLTMLAFLLVCLAGCGAASPQPSPTPQASPVVSEPVSDGYSLGPIIAVGHGAFIGPDGKELALDKEIIARAQTYYIDFLLTHAKRDQGEGKQIGDDVQKHIYGQIKDEIIANALFIDWLIEEVTPFNVAHLASINNALRWHYYLDVLQKERPKEDKWSKGVDPAIVEEMEKHGIPVTVSLMTEAGGKNYVDECRRAGVPVPDFMFSNEWSNRGVFLDEFISDGYEAELWSYSSTSPVGVCLALPRYGTDNKAKLLGIICLGTQSNKSCFFDNPRGRTFDRNVRVSIDEFVGGVDLVANAQGVCTDCHAGENPFVVHPEKTPFMDLSLMPTGWPLPLVDTSWPQNPGPANLLDAVASTQRCDACHAANLSGGRFPDVSTELPGYCNTVLSTAMGTSLKTTMPPFGSDRNAYIAHIDALKSACNARPSIGVVVEADYGDDTSHISPPIVMDPLYACSTQVAVSGSVLNAEVKLFVNDEEVGSLIARNPSHEEFTVSALRAGDKVTAFQEFNGATSATSAEITVRDHLTDFPNGLPAPNIDPILIHQCAEVIAVRHVPGARLTVYSNGDNSISRSTSTGWSTIRPSKRPFDVGDVFTAQISLCNAVSPFSTPQTAVMAPANIPAPTLNPGRIFEGQELITVESLMNGAQTKLNIGTNNGVLDGGGFTTPISRYVDYDVATQLGRPLAAGDQLVVQQFLCSAGPETKAPLVLTCERLPEPRIRHPQVGDSAVVVTQSVPGARIRVYDNNGIELGDGSGTVVVLRRPLNNTDAITAVQQLGDCTSKTGFRVSARNLNPLNKSAEDK